MVLCIKRFVHGLMTTDYMFTRKLSKFARKKYLNTLTVKEDKKEACRRMACGNCVLADSALLGEAVDFCIEVRCFLCAIDNL